MVTEAVWYNPDHKKPEGDAVYVLMMLENCVVPVVGLYAKKEEHWYEIKGDGVFNYLNKELFFWMYLPDWPAVSDRGSNMVTISTPEISELEEGCLDMPDDDENKIEPTW